MGQCGGSSAHRGACWASNRPVTVVPAAKKGRLGLSCELWVEICNVFQGRWAISRWIFQPVARVCGVGLRWAGHRVRGAVLHSAGRPCARRGSTLGGIVTCSAQAYAGQGGCVRGASPHWEGLTCIRRRTFRAGCPNFRRGLSPSLVVAYLTRVRAGKAASCSASICVGWVVRVRFRPAWLRLKLSLGPMFP